MSGTDRPTKKLPKTIEITREMIEAGADVFYDYDGLKFGTAETAAWAIFKAMVAASPTLRSHRVVER